MIANPLTPVDRYGTILLASPIWNVGHRWRYGAQRVRITCVLDHPSKTSWMPRIVITPC
jgi:hypothetical protein